MSVLNRALELSLGLETKGGGGRYIPGANKPSKKARPGRGGGQKHVIDEEYWGLPKGTPIKAGMEKGDKDWKRLKDQVTRKKRQTAKPRGPFKSAPKGRKYKTVTHAEMYKRWKPKAEATGDEGKEAFDSYGETGYEPINDMLRGNELQVLPRFKEEVTESTERSIEAMQSAMEPIGQDMLVHRFAETPAMNALKEGDVFMDQGFTSTSVDRATMENVRDETFFADLDQAVNFTIRVPKETPGFYLSAFASSPTAGGAAQKELVLAPATIYRVVSRKGQEIILEVVTK